MSDPDWHPDPEDGLRGDRLLSEALAPHALGVDEWPDDPGVYVLRCCSPGDSLESHARRWRDAGYWDTHPDAVPRLAEATRLLYVGSAMNVRSRIEDHVTGDRHRAAFVSVYPPFDVCLIEWCAPSRCRTVERQVADELADKHPEWAVWCDGVVR